MSAETVKLFLATTHNYEHLKDVQQWVKNGWPTKNVTNGAKAYWNHRDEIVESDGLTMKGNKVIVPKVLRPEMLQIIHSAHLGTEKWKRRARDSLFWPGMNTEIETKVKRCDVCQQYQRQNTKDCP